MKKIFVYGWYGHGNLGDETFKTAFTQLWPTVQFTFDSVLPSDINGYDALWIGGGSFLDQPIPSLDKVTLPIGFIGVGLGRYTDPVNQRFLNQAKIVIVRDSLSRSYFPKALLASDLAFAVKMDMSWNSPEKNIVVLCNDFLSPDFNAKEWQVYAYHWFSQEMAQCLDDLSDQGHKIRFLPMCVNPEFDDRRPATQIITRMKSRSKVEWGMTPMDEISLKQAISQTSCVLALRLHGAVFSSIIGTPFVLIGSHEKMKGLMSDLDTGAYLDYYGGFTHRGFINTFNQEISMSPTSGFAIAAADQWRSLSGSVAEAFTL